jgi:hypothetical protein
MLPALRGTLATAVPDLAYFLPFMIAQDRLILGQHSSHLLRLGSWQSAFCDIQSLVSKTA